MNKAIVIGYLQRDPEDTGKVTRFTIATKREYKNAENKYDYDYINCFAFSTTGELIKNHFKKGDIIGIEGTIQTSKYEKEGKMQYKTEINANKLHFIPSKGNSTPKEENVSNELKNEPKLKDETFEEFGNQIEIDELGW